MDRSRTRIFFFLFSRKIPITVHFTSDGFLLAASDLYDSAIWLDFFDPVSYRRLRYLNTGEKWVRDLSNPYAHEATVSSNLLEILESSEAWMLDIPSENMKVS